MKWPSISTRTLRLAGCFALLAIVAGWILGVWISGRIESVLKEGLRARGLEISWGKSMWDPIRGTRLRGIRLVEAGGSRKPIGELENLNLKIPLTQFLGKADRITFWQTDDSGISLHDRHGSSVKIQQISLRLTVTSDQIVIEQLSVKDRALSFDLTGSIKLRSGEELPSGPIRPDLSPIRDTLAMLDVRQGTGPFHITGNLDVDTRGAAPAWVGRLKGVGGNLEWKGVHYSKVTVNAELTTEQSLLHCELSTPNGSCGGVVEIPNARDQALTFEGTLRDARGHGNPFQGNYQNRVLTVENLEGEADLLAIARDFPQISTAFKDRVKFETFPHILARDIRKSAGTPWTIGSLEIKSSNTLKVAIDQRQLEVENLSANGSFDGNEWNIASSKANLMGGEFSLKGRHREGVLRRSTLVFDGIRVAELKQLANQGAARKGGGILTGRFQGELDFRRARLDGVGSVRMDKAPVIEVPLLDEVYELFTAMIPGVKRPNDGAFHAEFKADGDQLEVTRFEAKGGSSLTISAKGTVDLTKHRVAGRARAKLVGVPGLLTSPLSRLLEMEVAGPYEDIRVKPLGPVKLASNTVSGTVDVPIDVLEETGRITGTLLKEGIKMPFEWMKEPSQGGKKTAR